MNSTLFIGGLLYTFYGTKFSMSTTIFTTFIAQVICMILLPFAAVMKDAMAYWLCFSLLFVYGLFAGIN